MLVADSGPFVTFKRTQPRAETALLIIIMSFAAAIRAGFAARVRLTRNRMLFCCGQRNEKMMYRRHRFVQLQQIHVGCKKGR
jgi:hypothetical protein